MEGYFSREYVLRLAIGLGSVVVGLASAKARGNTWMLAFPPRKLNQVLR